MQQTDGYVYCNCWVTIRIQKWKALLELFPVPVDLLQMKRACTSRCTLFHESYSQMQQFTCPGRRLMSWTIKNEPSLYEENRWKHVLWHLNTQSKNLEGWSTWKHAATVQSPGSSMKSCPRRKIHYQTADRPNQHPVWVQMQSPAEFELGLRRGRKVHQQRNDAHYWGPPSLIFPNINSQNLLQHYKVCRSIRTCKDEMNTTYLDNSAIWFFQFCNPILSATHYWERVITFKLKQISKLRTSVNEEFSPW